MFEIIQMFSRSLILSLSFLLDPYVCLISLILPLSKDTCYSLRLISFNISLLLISSGTSGEVSYFEIFTYGSDGKRIQNSNGVFTFETFTVGYNGTAGSITGSLPDLNSYTGNMKPCTPHSTVSVPHKENVPRMICHEESDSGHYYGTYIPVRTGLIGLNIYFLSTTAGDKE